MIIFEDHMFGRITSMYCCPTASIRHGESLSMAKRVVKAEFEMDISYYLAIY